MRALVQSPLLHPFDVFVVLARLVGQLSVFHDDLVPGDIPVYDHDRPGVAFGAVHKRIVLLLEAMRPMAYIERRFARKKDARGQDGLEVEIDRRWIDDNLEMYIGLHSDEMDIHEVERHVYSRLNLKLSHASGINQVLNRADRHGPRTESMVDPDVRQKVHVLGSLHDGNRRGYAHRFGLRACEDIPLVVVGDGN